MMQVPISIIPVFWTGEVCFLQVDVSVSELELSTTYMLYISDGGKKCSLKQLKRWYAGWLLTL